MKTVTRHSDPRDVAGPGTWKTAKKKRHRNHKLKQIIGRPSLYKIPASAGLWGKRPGRSLLSKAFVWKRRPRGEEVVCLDVTKQR